MHEGRSHRRVVLVAAAAAVCVSRTKPASCNTCRPPVCTSPSLTFTLLSRRRLRVAHESPSQHDDRAPFRPSRRTHSNAQVSLR